VALLASAAAPVVAATTITSGQLVAFLLPAVTEPTLFTGNFSHSIQVALGATELRISLQANANVNLYVRRNGEVEGSAILNNADYRSESPTGFESIVIPNPEPGLYFIAYSLPFAGGPASVTLTATVVFGACTYSLSPANTANYGSGPGSGVFVVSTTPGCPWSVTTDSPWLTLLTFAGAGTGSVQYQVAPNSGLARSGTITVGGQTFTVIQAGNFAAMPDNALLISQFVAGGEQWSTTVFVTNLSPSAETLTLRFYDGQGAPLAMPMAGYGTVTALTATLQPGETRRLETAAAPSLLVGWAVIVPGSPAFRRLNGFAVFRQRIGSSFSEAVVGFTSPREFRHALLFDAADGYETGVALANPDPESFADIRVEIRAESGVLLGVETIRLPPLGHTSFAVSRRFPVAAGRRGSMRLSAGSRPITGLGLRFAPGGAAFTSFPLVSSPDFP
jgi:hypothetical protein